MAQTTVPTIPPDPRLEDTEDLDSRVDALLRDIDQTAQRVIAQTSDSAGEPIGQAEVQAETSAPATDPSPDVATAAPAPEAFESADSILADVSRELEERAAARGEPAPAPDPGAEHASEPEATSPPEPAAAPEPERSPIAPAEPEPSPELAAAERSAEPEPVAPEEAAPDQASPIEALDAALAANATRVLEEETKKDREPTPAAPGAAAPPAPDPAPVSRAQAPVEPAAPAATPKAKVVPPVPAADTVARSPSLRARAGALAAAALAPLARPAEKLSYRTRQTLAWAGVETLFVAACLWGFVLLRGPSAPPERTSDPTELLRPGDPTPPPKPKPKPKPPAASKPADHSGSHGAKPDAHASKPAKSKAPAKSKSKAPAKEAHGGGH